MTVRQCYKELDVSRQYILELIKKGKLKASMSAEKKKEYVVDETSFQKYKEYREKIALLKTEFNKPV